MTKRSRKSSFMTMAYTAQYMGIKGQSAAKAKGTKQLVTTTHNRKLLQSLKSSINKIAAGNSTPSWYVRYPDKYLQQLLPEGLQ